MNNGINKENEFYMTYIIIKISRGNKDVPETQKSAEKRPKHTSGHTL